MFVSFYQWLSGTHPYLCVQSQSLEWVLHLRRNKTKQKDTKSWYAKQRMHSILSVQAVKHKYARCTMKWAMCDGVTCHLWQTMPPLNASEERTRFSMPFCLMLAVGVSVAHPERVLPKTNTCIPVGRERKKERWNKTLEWTEVTKQKGVSGKTGIWWWLGGLV